MVDIDKLLEREIKQETYRKEYNQRSEVIDRRKAYNVRKAETSKVARMVMNGDITRDEGIQMLSRIEGQKIESQVDHGNQNESDDENA